MPSRPLYRCAHCGQGCGVTGHLRRGPGSCLNAPLVPVARNDDDVIALGYCCPPGHTCMTYASGGYGACMTQPVQRRNWREDKPTLKQLEFLDSLGYTGPKPVTKGQAHDLLDYITGVTTPLPIIDTRVRAYRLRK